MIIPALTRFAPIIITKIQNYSLWLNTLLHIVYGQKKLFGGIDGVVRTRISNDERAEFGAELSQGCPALKFTHRFCGSIQDVDLKI